MSNSFRPRSKEALKDVNGSDLAGAALSTTEVFTKNYRPRGDRFGLWVDFSGAFGGNLQVKVYWSEDGGVTWADYPSGVGSVAAAANTTAGFSNITAAGATGGYWDNIVADNGSPDPLIRFGFDMSAGTATLDAGYLLDGSFGGR